MRLRHTPLPTFSLPLFSPLPFPSYGASLSLYISEARLCVAMYASRPLNHGRATLRVRDARPTLFVRPAYTSVAREGFEVCEIFMRVRPYPVRGFITRSRCLALPALAGVGARSHWLFKVMPTLYYMTLPPVITNMNIFIFYLCGFNTDLTWGSGSATGNIACLTLRPNLLPLKKQSSRVLISYLTRQHVRIRQGSPATI